MRSVTKHLAPAEIGMLFRQQNFKIESETSCYIIDRQFDIYNKGYVYIVFKSSKIHLWRHSIVLALHYFQGMACYRSATLLEVMDTRSFWIMIVFSRVIYLRSCISEVHSNNSCFSINKKNRWWQLVSNPRRHKTTLDVVLVLSPPLYQLSYHSAEGEGLNSDIWNI